MKKQLVILGIVAILVSVGLSGCTQDSNTGLEQSEDSHYNYWNLV